MAAVDAAGDESDGEYQVRRLRADEDLVIDGENAVDDMLVAQRFADVAEREAAALRTDGPPSAATPGALARKVRSQPDKDDLQKLLELLQQTNELSKRISDLPQKFDGIVGQEVRKACRVAASAMERIPMPESFDVDAIGVPEEAQAKLAQEAALAHLDLDSTSGEEEEGAAEAPVSASVAPVVAAHAPATAPVAAAAGSGKPADEDVEDLDDDAWIASALERMVGKVEEPSSEEELEQHEGAPTIRLDTVPMGLDERAPVERAGVVHALLEGLVVVRGDSDGKALDLQSVLCTEGREVIGVVIDVFGLIKHPHYLVYSTCAQKESLALDTVVYAAVTLPETSFICDSSDLQAVRAALMQDTAENGRPDSDSDEASDDDDPSDAEQKLQAQSAHNSKGERKGKGKGKGKKGKGDKGRSTDDSKGSGKNGKGDKGRPTDDWRQPEERGQQEEWGSASSEWRKPKEEWRQEEWPQPAEEWGHPARDQRHAERQVKQEPAVRSPPPPEVPSASMARAPPAPPRPARAEPDWEQSKRPRTDAGPTAPVHAPPAHLLAPPPPQRQLPPPPRPPQGGRGIHRR